MNAKREKGGGADGRDVAPKPAKAKSLRELAKLAGVGLTTARRWARHPKWTFRRGPPYDVAAVCAWRDEHLRKDPAREPGPQEEGAEGISQKARVDILWRLRRAEREKLLIDIASGRVHDVAACRARRLLQLRDLRKQLLDLPRELAPKLAGRSSDEVEAVLSARVAEICNGFAASIPPQPAPASAPAPTLSGG